MPVISRFFGIAVAILCRDHEPPHIHVRYGEFAATVEIRSGLVRGSFPTTALSLVQSWRALHLDALLANLELARLHRPLEPIPPLE
jgi:hypothetical protein